ncbi:hypothetical protein BDW69DRAFT_102971 [Aspergillus filifer]
MLFTRGILGSVLLSPSVVGHLHNFYSGFYSGNSLYGIQFDELSSQLTVVYNGTLDVQSSQWIATDKLHRNLYIADDTRYDSYAIRSDKSLVYQGSASIPGSCDWALYIVSSTEPPFTAFGAPYSKGCPGQVITADATGTLRSVVANISYSSISGVHGLALSSDNRFIYSADDMGSAVWVHSYDAISNKVSMVQQLNVTGNPRHLTVHPHGSYVYVVLETSNEVAVFNRDLISGRLSATNTTFSLLPSGFSSPATYWADEVIFSVAREGSYPKYLFASTRALNSTFQGFVTAFSLDSDTGAIKDRLFLLPTTGSGGGSNAVSPAIFSEEYFAIADAGDNFVEVWKLHESGTMASVVAHLDIDESPSNLVWMD